MPETYMTPEEFFAALDATPPPHPNDALMPQGRRICPICQARMASEAQFGVMIDVCPAHGVWLDHGEIEVVVSVARQLRPEIGRSVIAQARREGKWRGIIFGWLALLMDD